MGSQRNIRLVLEYDGGSYHGLQLQPEVITIQEVLEDRISKITQHPSRIVAAGRTDAGVHALQQVVHFHTTSRLSVQVLKRGLNALLPPDIRILEVDEVAGSFHARFSALGKHYEYRIWNAPVPSAFHHRYAWWIPTPLAVPAMGVAARALVGRHDFSSFRSADHEGRHAIREVKVCEWRVEGPLRIFRIEADAFLRYMVRVIVGTLVEVGLGKRRAEEVVSILEARDRTLAGITAPARGLFLVSVSYPPPWSLGPVRWTAQWPGFEGGATAG